MTAMAGQECDAVCKAVGQTSSQAASAASEAKPPAPPAQTETAPQAPAEGQTAAPQSPAASLAPPPQPVSAEPKSAPAPLEQYYSLLGKWHGRGEYHVHDGKPIKLSMRMTCSKAPDDSAVACELSFKGGGSTGRATELFVPVPSSDKVERFVVDDATLTRSEAEWTDNRTMKSGSSWRQDGEKMQSRNTTVVSGKMLDYKNVTTANGKTTGVLTAHLTR